MPRRTKQWWAALDKWERQWLVEAEYAMNHGSGYGAGGYLPDDCSECDICGVPVFGSGICPRCRDMLDRIIEKANDAVLA